MQEIENNKTDAQAELISPPASGIIGNLRRYTSKIKNLSGKFGLYFIANSMNKAIPFILIPILTRYLTPAEYGLWGIYQVLINFATPFINLNMPINVDRNIHKVKKDEMGSIIFNMLFILTILVTLSIVIFLILTLFVKDLFSVPARWLNALPIIVFTNTINWFNLYIIRNNNDPVRYGMFEIGCNLLNLSLAILLVVGLHFKWSGMILSLMTASLIFSIISIINMSRTGYIKIGIDRKRIKEILKFSIPLIPHSIGAAILVLSDRLFIERMIGKEAVGIYIVGYSFGLTLQLITDAFYKSWAPWLYKQLNEINDNKKLKIVKYTYIYCISLLLMAFVVSLVSIELIKIMTPQKYHIATNYVIWVMTGIAFYGMYFTIIPYVIHTGKSTWLGALSFSTAIANLLLNYLLIRINGPLGAAQATLISYIILAAGIWIMSMRAYEMPWFFWKSGKVKKDNVV